jgi:hypothetical protein
MTAPDASPVQGTGTLKPSDEGSTSAPQILSDPLHLGWLRAGLARSPKQLLRSVVRSTARVDPRVSIHGPLKPERRRSNVNCLCGDLKAGAWPGRLLCGRASSTTLGVRPALSESQAARSRRPGCWAGRSRSVVGRPGSHHADRLEREPRDTRAVVARLLGRLTHLGTRCNMWRGRSNLVPG